VSGTNAEYPGMEELIENRGKSVDKQDEMGDGYTGGQGTDGDDRPKEGLTPDYGG